MTDNPFFLPGLQVCRHHPSAEAPDTGIECPGGDSRHLDVIRRCSFSQSTLRRYDDPPLLRHRRREDRMLPDLAGGIPQQDVSRVGGAGLAWGPVRRGPGGPLGWPGPQD